MLSFLRSQLRFRRGRAATLAAGIVVAAVAFVLLTAATRTSSIQVRGTIESNYRAAYDVLVRPKGAATRIEREAGLVRSNFLAGIFGGIRLDEYETIKQISGVEVAAPVANVGYVLPFTDVPIRINNVLTDEPRQLYRLRKAYVANGLSRYPDSRSYVYYTRRNRFVDENHLAEVMPGRRPLPVCSGVSAHNLDRYGPFARSAFLDCFSARSPELSARFFAHPFAPPGWVGSVHAGYFPVLLAAIDPAEEAKLLELDRTLVAGRYLHQDEPVGTVRSPGGSVTWPAVPVLASSESYVADTLEVTVERLRVPPGTDLPRALASGACRKAVIPCPERVPAPVGAAYEDAYGFLRDLPGEVVDRRSTAFSQLYERLLADTLLPLGSYWTIADVRYRRLGEDLYRPRPVRNPISVWEDPAYFDTGRFFPAPPDNRDVQFRLLRPHVYEGEGVVGPQVVARIVGRFDPRKLPGFSPLSEVPLETYYPPALRPANGASERALGGGPFLPTQNLGGYIAQPPLLLTTLEGLEFFLDQAVFRDVPSWRARAPISAIRIRVADVTGPDPVSHERVRAVAEEIHERTGLDVDITAGSSPHPVQISLPAGTFGRPELLLQEGWSQKGVSISFLRALDRKDLALFGLILVVCTFFLGNGAFAAVRARRSEIGSLLTLGWSRGEIFRAILGELLLVGFLAGLAGTGVAALLVAVLSLDFPLARTLFVAPVAVVLALLAGFLPAWRAARGTPLDAILPPVAAGRRARRVRSLVPMALANLGRLPARTLVGAAGLVIGVAALTVLLGIQRAFQGTLVGTLLGNAISLEVRSADFVAAGLTIALAALSLADVLYLNLRERSAELVTLRTLGWSEREVSALVVLEGLVLGLLGSLAGAVLGIALAGLLLGVPVVPVAVGAALSAGGGTLAAALASLMPFSQISRLTAPKVLAAE